VVGVNFNQKIFQKAYCSTQRFRCLSTTATASMEMKRGITASVGTSGTVGDGAAVSDVVGVGGAVDVTGGVGFAANGTVPA
jgi:hypothetical protein